VRQHRVPVTPDAAVQERIAILTGEKPRLGNLRQVHEGYGQTEQQKSPAMSM